MNGFFDRLKAVGYSELRKENPKKTVQLLCQYLAPRQLRDVMTNRVDYDTGLEKDVKAFVRELTTQAVACHTYGTRERTGSNFVTGHKKSPAEHKPEKQSQNLPVCLWPPHAVKGWRHKIMDCRDCPEDEKKRLLDDHRKKRRERSEGNAAGNAVRKVAASATNPVEGRCSTVFACTYAN